MIVTVAYSVIVLLRELVYEREEQKSMKIRSNSLQWLLYVRYEEKET